MRDLLVEDEQLTLYSEATSDCSSTSIVKRSYPESGEVRRSNTGDSSRHGWHHLHFDDQLAVRLIAVIREYDIWRDGTFARPLSARLKQKWLATHVAKKSTRTGFEDDSSNARFLNACDRL